MSLPFKSTLIASRLPVACLAIATLAGCNRPTAQAPSASLGNAAITAVVGPPAVAFPMPRPTPTPDPLQKFRTIQQVPAWSERRVINDVPIKPGQKLFALTFDDGPWPHSTEQILQILDEHNVKATFYMVGEVVRSYPQIARKVRDGGHALGNHSWSHPSRPRDPVAEVQKTNAEIKKATGVSPSTFRPPYGMLKNGLAREANRAKMPVIIWSSDSNDWRRPPASSIARNVVRHARPGGIALLHDGGGPRSRTVQALPTIIRELQARGYRLVTVPELLKARYIAPAKPKKSTSASAKTQSATASKGKLPAKKTTAP